MRQTIKKNLSPNMWKNWCSTHIRCARTVMRTRAHKKRVRWGWLGSCCVFVVLRARDAHDRYAPYQWSRSNHFGASGSCARARAYRFLRLAGIMLRVLYVLLKLRFGSCPANYMSITYRWPKRGFLHQRSIVKRVCLIFFPPFKTKTELRLIFFPPFRTRQVTDTVRYIRNIGIGTIW
jgi:hypothetical protein